MSGSPHEGSAILHGGGGSSVGDSAPSSPRIPNTLGVVRTVGLGSSVPVDLISFADKVANNHQLTTQFSAMLHDYREVCIVWCTVITRSHA